MKKACWLLAVLVGGILLAGCGGGSNEETERPSASSPPLDRLRVTLEGDFGPANVAIPMTQQDYFRDLGVLISFASPVSPVRPILYVATGTDDIGISHLPEVALARQRGEPVVAIGSLVSQPTTAMIWLKRSRIDGLRDLEGRTIAIPGLRFQERFLESVLKRAGLTLGDVEVKRVGYNLLPALISGRADAVFGGSGNIEGVWLEMRGLEPVVLPVSELGIPEYDELVVIARSDFAAEHAEQVRQFMAVLSGGNAAAEADPEAAFEAIEQSVSPLRETGGKEMRAELAATLPLLSEDGEMDPARAEALTEWMQKEGMLQQALPASELLTNDYLPGS